LFLIRAFGFPATPDSSISFAGNDAYLYRLTITTAGFFDYSLPLAVSRSTSTDVEVRGWNVPDDARRVTIAPTEKDFVLAYHANLANSVLLPVVSHPSVVAVTNSSRSSPQTLTFPCTVTGVIDSPRDEDVFRFSAKKGQVIALEVESDRLGFLLDPYLAVSDPPGKTLADADDTRRARDPQLSFTAPADGDFFLTVKDMHGHGGPRYVYRMTVQEPRPDFSLKTSADSFSVKRGATVEIPVTIERNKDFDQEIEIVAVGLPTGITASPVKSAAKGDTAKSVKLILQATAEAQSGPFEVVGKTAGDTPLERKSRLGGDGVPASVSQAWITAQK
jgi:hypothetical protein